MIRRALLLIGSPKRHKSTSNSLGGYLFELLSAKSIQTEIVYLYSVVGSPTRMRALLDGVNEADLVVLAFPLYVDSLPAPIIEALERVSADRQARQVSRHQSFAAIANCGFPEAHHNRTALAICEAFARHAGFEWGGSLALGGGEAVGGVPLAQKAGQTAGIRTSLDLAAKALAVGQVIPKAAQDILGKPTIPHWVYRMMGGLGWIWRARRYGVGGSLKQQPYGRMSE
jgi:NAD(P)H-dependent FMN reductase